MRHVNPNKRHTFCLTDMGIVDGWDIILEKSWIKDWERMLVAGHGRRRHVTRWWRGIRAVRIVWRKMVSIVRCWNRMILPSLILRRWEPIEVLRFSLCRYNLWQRNGIGQEGSHQIEMIMDVRAVSELHLYTCRWRDGFLRRDLGDARLYMWRMRNGWLRCGRKFVGKRTKYGCWMIYGGPRHIEKSVRWRQRLSMRWNHRRLPLSHSEMLIEWRQWWTDSWVEQRRGVSGHLLKIRQLIR